MKEFTPEALSEFAGTDGRPAYVAHGGRVFDVSSSSRWKGGLHMRRHKAGQDLTADLQAAPHGAEMLERVPQVGVLRPGHSEEEPTERGPLGILLQRFPRLRRHPHPMTVHFPITFACAATAFGLLRLLTGVESLGSTAFHCVLGLVVSVPVAGVTGLLTWRVNYAGRKMRPVTIKRRLTAVILLGSVAAALWFGVEPGVFDAGSRLLFLALLLGLAGLVSIVGWFGATLTFPAGKE